MREDALIAEVRRAAQLPDSFADYTDAIIRTELNTQLQQRFARIMVKARVGMMLKRYSQTLTSGTATYPLPSRAMHAGAECLSISLGTSSWPLEQIEAHQVWQYENMSTDRPRFYAMLGSSYRLYPTPNDAYTLRVQYYLRPSRIVEKQDDSTIGQVSAVDQTARTLTVTTYSSIVDKDTGTALSASRRIDLVRGPPLVVIAAVQGYDASYEVVMPSATFSVVSTTLTLAGTTDMSEVQVGDYVRVADQSEWPSIPHEYHPALCWSVAAKIARDRGMMNTAQALEADVVRALDELADDIQPRVKSSAQTLVPRAHMLRGRGSWGL